VAEENPLAGYSDDGLVAEAWSQGARQGVFAIEMTRRLMNATVKQNRAPENVGNKIKACEEVGIRSEHHALPASTTTAELLDLIHSLLPRELRPGGLGADT